MQVTGTGESNLLFDERPKNNKKDLYDAEEELKSLTDALEKGAPLVTIVGLRRTGKTSILLTALNNIARPSIILDMRTLASRPYASKRDLIQEAERAINEFYNLHLSLGKRLFRWLARIKGVEISKTGISISWGGKQPVDLSTLFEGLNAWAKHEKTTLIIAFDEAQELKKIAGVDMEKIIAHIYDYDHNLSIVLTGSAVGLLYDFVGCQNPKAPLYGRHITEIRLRRLSAENSREFLLRGFKQAKIKNNEEIIQTALKKLDGVIGWLTLFGTASVNEGTMSEKTIDQTVQQGKLLARQEFENFLKGREVARQRYETIIRHLAAVSTSSWSTIKRAVEATEGKTVNDKNITDLISNLVKAGFVEKENELYHLSDQMLSESFK